MYKLWTRKKYFLVTIAIERRYKSGIHVEA